MFKSSSHTSTRHLPPAFPLRYLQRSAAHRSSCFVGAISMNFQTKSPPSSGLNRTSPETRRGSGTSRWSSSVRDSHSRLWRRVKTAPIRSLNSSTTCLGGTSCSFTYASLRFRPGTAESAETDARYRSVKAKQLKCSRYLASLSSTQNVVSIGKIPLYPRSDTWVAFSADDNAGAGYQSFVVPT